MKAKILIAEDDPNIRLGLMTTLESEGHDVTAAGDGAQALKLYPQGKYDLVILDIMMPKMSGYDVCREIRAKDARVPVLFLSAKGEEIDKVVGLKLGADDYMTKPFGVHELIARVEALLRRARLDSATVDAAADLPAVFKLGDALVDRKKFTVTLGKNEESLTAREMKLAEIFAAHPGEVLARDALLNAVWGVEYYGTTRTLDQHVAQLRKKVERKPDEPVAIITVHGVGYRYEP
ncbi:DNA-binding response OmpR family regulator [Ereboglobus sp. PH5-5]|uniref:DNA-binding response regulator n=1 Tax=Ereboglobus luteus TaxID=1796921 RepID=A0A2U8E5V2_9BACT|nr:MULTISPECIES: response regulator transcription factor [Ereboglobus]AWI10190.1 DNA-binding response regulator [Ereboglobus luteus]MDF9827099.1 DNA-binding response OmpR family regulator [Ereboglobus sp. PH5-10]MDF9832515.1 DNA-binding response OmpR family regulator [Ereboglobus sp. PH5-5]